MFKKALFPGKYIQGVGATSELPALIDLLGKRGLILASPSANDRVLPGCGVDWSARGLPIEVFRGECCEDELSRLSASIAQAGADVLVGMGGGKTIDTAHRTQRLLTSISFSPDGRFLATLGRHTDSTIRILDTKDFSMVQRYQAHALCGAMIRFSPDGKQMASASDDESLRLYRTEAFQSSSGAMPSAH